jgi:hypothetical protein
MGGGGLMLELMPPRREKSMIVPADWGCVLGCGMRWGKYA